MSTGLHETSPFARDSPPPAPALPRAAAAPQQRPLILAAAPSRYLARVPPAGYDYAAASLFLNNLQKEIDLLPGVTKKLQLLMHADYEVSPTIEEMQATLSAALP